MAQPVSPQTLPKSRDCCDKSTSHVVHVAWTAEQSWSCSCYMSMQDVLHMAPEVDKNPELGSGEGAINVQIGNDVGDDKTEVSRSELQGAKHQIGKDLKCKPSADCWTGSTRNIIDAWQTTRPRSTRTTKECPLNRERTRLRSRPHRIKKRRWKQRVSRKTIVRVRLGQMRCRNSPPTPAEAMVELKMRILQKLPPLLFNPDLLQTLL